MVKLFVAIHRSWQSNILVNGFIKCNGVVWHPPNKDVFSINFSPVSVVRLWNFLTNLHNAIFPRIYLICRAATCSVLAYEYVNSFICESIYNCLSSDVHIQRNASAVCLLLDMPRFTTECHQCTDRGADIVATSLWYTWE